MRPAEAKGGEVEELRKQLSATQAELESAKKERDRARSDSPGTTAGILAGAAGGSSGSGRRAATALCALCVALRRQHRARARAASVGLAAEAAFLDAAVRQLRA